MGMDSLSMLPAASPYLSIIVPVYNEETRIGNTLKEILAYFNAQDYTYEILVVDDGSNDATCTVVSAIAAEQANLHILHYDANRGKGHAVRYGMMRAEGNFM